LRQYPLYSFVYRRQYAAPQQYTQVYHKSAAKKSAARDNKQLLFGKNKCFGAQRAYCKKET
jgi:hypothetical protein